MIYFLLASFSLSFFLCVYSFCSVNVTYASQDLPRNMTLDGELFGGRGQFQSTVKIVKTAGCDDYKKIKYHVSNFGFYS